MKVKELIAELQKLDQERGIWIAYDFPQAMIPPVPDDRADKIHVELFGEKQGVELGDYIINAW